jgi:hypothetical protein
MRAGPRNVQNLMVGVALSIVTMAGCGAGEDVVATGGTGTDGPAASANVTTTKALEPSSVPLSPPPVVVVREEGSIVDLPIRLFEQKDVAFTVTVKVAMQPDGRFLEFDFAGASPPKEATAWAVYVDGALSSRFSSAARGVFGTNLSNREGMRAVLVLEDRSGQEMGRSDLVEMSS